MNLNLRLNRVKLRILSFNVSRRYVTSYLEVLLLSDQKVLDLRTVADEVHLGEVDLDL